MINYDYFCSRCKNHEFFLKEGVLCKLTNAKPDFVDECNNFILDLDRDRKQEYAYKRLEALEERSEENTFFAQEKKGIQKGILGGIIMIAIAVIWFVVGFAAGYIFFYPPILFIIGVYAFIKGMIKGNISGKPSEPNPYNMNRK